MTTTAVADPGAADSSVSDVGEVARALGTDFERGLSAAEAAARLEQDGPNGLRTVPARTAWRRALAQVEGPLVALLLVAAGVALVAWWVEGRQGFPVDAVVIAVVVFLNGLIGWLQEAMAASAAWDATLPSRPS